MAETNIGATTTTNLTNSVEDYSVDIKQTDGVQDQEETTYDYPNFTKYYGYYKQIPELKKSIDALGIWTVGKGYDCDAMTKVTLEHISGMGKDIFDNILFNMFIIMKINGDSFAEIIKDQDTGTLLNLKPLDPASMRIVLDRRGIIKRYEQRNKLNKNAVQKFKPQDILHFMNERTADELHGCSVVEACQWVIDARNEAMSDKRRVHHRSTIRIIEVDTDNSTQLSTIKAQYAEAIKNGEVLIVPKGNFNFPEAPISFIDTQEWIRYLENFFYQAVGIPRVIANSENFTEASSKIGYLTFEPVYSKEQMFIEKYLWNQLGIKITLNRPPSLMGNLMSDEEKNTGQTNIQPNDMTAMSGAESG
jgi:hypothetical protein